jgi:hypothetical protein
MPDERDELVEVEVGGATRQGVRVAVTEGNEPSGSYALADGSRIRARLVLIDVIRVVGMFDEQGAPIYVLKYQVPFGVNAPPNLRKDAQK